MGGYAAPQALTDTLANWAGERRGFSLLRVTEADLTKAEYTGKDFDDELFIELRTPKMCADLFELLCAHGGPEQKVIIFCTREIHADRVAQLNGY